MAVKSPLELLYWILSLAGMTVPPGSKYPRVLQCYCYMHATNLVIFLLTNTYQIFMSDEIVEEKLGIAQHVLSTVHIIGKHFNILFRTVEIRRYFGEIEDMWKEATKGGKNSDLFEKAAKSAYRSTVVLLPGYFGLAPLTVIIWVVSNLLSDEKSLPMKTWTPFGNYWVSSFYQIFSFLSVVLSAGVIKSYERNIFMQIDAQLKVMQRLLIDRNQDPLEHKKIYKYHQRILKLVEGTNYNFAGQAMLEMALSALQIALRLSSCIMALLAGNPMFASFFLNLVLATIAPYIICLHGTILLDEGENIYRSAYQNGWYNEKTKTSKDLLILQSMAHKPLEFHYKNVFKFSLFQFTTVMQAAYSYLVAIKYFAGSNGLDD